MTSVEVGPQSLRDSADAAAIAAEAVRGLGLDCVDGLKGALPGSDSGGTSSKLADHWTGNTKTWSKNVDGYAEALDAAADRYEWDDQAAAEDFD